MIKKIIQFFRDDREEIIGVIAAEKILDFIINEVGIDIYNKGVNDAKKIVIGKIGDIEMDIDALLKSK